MRAALFLLAGLTLVVAGVAVIALGVPGRFLLGPALIVAGLLFKVGGFLLTDDPAEVPANGGRTVTKLGGQAVERPRAGIPGRTSSGIRVRPRPATARRAASRPAATSLPDRPDRPDHDRRAS